jgi:Amt family ammonium transporter
VIGTRGFLLQGTSDAAGLSRFVSFWPLCIACAVMLAGALAARARALSVAALTVAVAGIAFPIAGCWVWGGGWLHALGDNAGLGRGAIDLGRIGVIGLVAGAGGAAWIGALPRREARGPAELSDVHFPARAVAGVLCVLIGSMPFGIDLTLAMGQFVNTSLAVSAAILAAGAYAIFTTRSADVMTASHAALAAVFAASSGAALMPIWVMIALGIACGLLATLGDYAVRERLRLADDGAVIACAFVPAALGMFATGLFASGDFGVAGMFAGMGEPSDPGQLVAQAAAVVAIATLAWGLASIVIALARQVRVQTLIPPELDIASSPVPVPAAALPAAVAASEWAATRPEVNGSSTQSQDRTTVDTGTTSESAASPDRFDKRHDVPRREAGILGWLRRASTSPNVPKQPRRTAYPYRVGGRPLATRPIAPDTGPASAPLDDSTPRKAD